MLIGAQVSLRDEDLLKFTGDGSSGLLKKGPRVKILNGEVSLPLLELGPVINSQLNHVCSVTAAIKFLKSDDVSILRNFDSGVGDFLKKFKTKHTEKIEVAESHQEMVGASERASSRPVPGGATTAETLDEAVKYIRHNLPDMSTKKLVMAVRRQFPELETSGVKVGGVFEQAAQHSDR